MIDSRPLRESLSLLTSPRFGTFWLACLLANIGTWAQQLAQPWLLLSLGATPFLVGLDAFAAGAPSVLLTFVGGILADSADRRQVILRFQSLQALCPIAIALALATGHVHPWMVIVASLAIGATDALSMPSFQTIVSTIVARDRLAAALELNATQFNLSRVLGPAVGAALMAGVGALGAYLVNAMSYVPFIAVALWMLPRGVATAIRSEVRPGSTVMDALRAVTKEGSLRGAVSTVLVGSAFCGPVVTFCPVLVRDAFGGSVALLGAAVAAFGLGGMAGAGALLGIDARADRRPIASFGALAFALAVAAVALVPVAWALPVLTFVAGAAMTACNVSANAVVQLAAAAELRGRAISLYMIAMRGGLATGAIVTGAVVHVLGVRGALLCSAVCALALQGAVAASWRRHAIAAHPDRLAS